MDSAIQRLNNRALDPGGNQFICFSEDKAQSTRYLDISLQPPTPFNPDSGDGILNHSGSLGFGGESLVSYGGRSIRVKKKRFQKYLESCGRGLNRELRILRREQLPDFLNTK